MTVNRKEKDENRAYAAEHGISYTAAKRALDAVRNNKRIQDALQNKKTGNQKES